MGKTHFWGKSNLTFGASKHPKMHAIGIYIHVLYFFFSRREAEELFSPPQFFLWYPLLHDWAPGIFHLHHSPTLGFSQAAGNSLCYKFIFELLWVCFSLTWVVISSLPWAVDSFLVMICGWVPFPNVLLHFPNVCQAENHFCVLNTVIVVYGIRFFSTLGPKRPWDTIFYSGLFLLSLETSFVDELFSSTQKWCILTCMQLFFGLCRSGNESS